MENFGVSLKMHRLRCGLMQKELAKKAGVDGDSISKYERGKRTPPIITAQNLAKALGVPLGELIGYQAEEQATYLRESHQGELVYGNFIAFLRGMGLSMTNLSYHGSREDYTVHEGGGTSIEKPSLIIDVDGLGYEVGMVIDNIMDLTGQYVQFLVKQHGERLG